MSTFILPNPHIFRLLARGRCLVPKLACTFFLSWWKLPFFRMLSRLNSGPKRSHQVPAGGVRLFFIWKMYISGYIMFQMPRPRKICFSFKNRRWSSQIKGDNIFLLICFIFILCSLSSSYFSRAALHMNVKLESNNKVCACIHPFIQLHWFTFVSSSLLYSYFVYLTCK